MVQRHLDKSEINKVFKKAKVYNTPRLVLKVVQAKEK